ncbi:MAG: GntR family transcriptional regulator [Gemmatimonadetes bacterium]|nr:GntR family transcriptional regulator [Gemmatimonadota bacterium]
MSQRHTPADISVADALRQRRFSALHLGVLKPGDRLPSVRELARERGTTARLDLAAGRALEREGLVELRPRSGLYVASATSMAGEALPQAADWMVDVLVQGLLRGVPAPAFPERFRRGLTTLRLRAACLECNADQIAALCAELHRDYGLETTGIDTHTLLPGRDMPTHELQAADLLVTTPFHVHEVRPVAQRLNKPLIVLPLRPDLFAEVARLLPEGPVYFVMVDPIFASKLHEIFAATPGAAHLRPLVVGRDDLGEIPPDAPTYVTPLAREQLGQPPLRPGMLPLARVSDPQAARELLAFIVRANLTALATRPV